MNLEPEERDDLIERILEGFRRSFPDSKASLRGSLSGGFGDEYSDIDIMWVIPRDHFAACLHRLHSILSEIQPIESMRWDPEFRGNGNRRVVFVRFVDVPLFWRVDVDIRSDSDACPRLEIEQDRLPWSRTESALMNAVAAIKAHLRDEDSDAVAFLSRAFNRIGLELPKRDLRSTISELLDAVEKMEPASAMLSDRIRVLVNNAFTEPGD